MVLARVITYLLHPILVPLLGMILMMHVGGWVGYLAPEAKKYIYLVVTVTTILLPLSSLLLLRSRGWVESFELALPKERRIPLLIGSFFYLCGAFILQRVQAPMVIPLFLNATAIVILLNALITPFFKISNHMTSFGCLIGLFLAISFRWLINMQIILAILILAAGLIGVTRLLLQKHRPIEVYAGFLLGFVVTFVVVRLV